MNWEAAFNEWYDKEWAGLSVYDFGNKMEFDSFVRGIREAFKAGWDMKGKG